MRRCPGIKPSRTTLSQRLLRRGSLRARLPQRYLRRGSLRARLPQRYLRRGPSHTNPTSPLGDRWFRGMPSQRILLPRNPLPSGEGFTPSLPSHWKLPLSLWVALFFIQSKKGKDKTRQDKTRQDKARRGKTRQDKSREEKTRQDKTSQHTSKRRQTVTNRRKTSLATGSLWGEPVAESRFARDRQTQTHTD